MIKINCRKVYQAGLKYDKASEIVKNEQYKLNKISKRIEEIWKGGDSNNFLCSFDEHIKALDDIIRYLEDKSIVLRKKALEHSNADNNFSNKMKRSDINEQQY